MYVKIYNNLQWYIFWGITWEEGRTMKLSLSVSKHLSLYIIVDWCPELPSALWHPSNEMWMWYSPSWAGCNSLQNGVWDDQHDHEREEGGSSLVSIRSDRDLLKDLQGFGVQIHPHLPHEPKCRIEILYDTVSFYFIWIFSKLSSTFQILIFAQEKHPQPQY